MTTLRLFGTLPLVLMVALCGCGHPVQETAAHKIADALPRVLGSAARYDVQVDGDPFALSRGRARAVHIQGRAVQISPTLTLDTLNADADDVSFSRETRRLEHVGRTRFAATLGQDGLTRALARSKPLLPGLVVTLGADDVRADVPVTFLGLSTTVRLSGTFAPDPSEPGKLDFIPDGARVGFVPLPSALANLALDRLNPVVDLSHQRVPLTLTSAGIANGRLTLEGQVDLNGLAAGN